MMVNYTITHLKQGVATIASVHVNGLEYGGLAICGKNDRYNAQRGRDIAYGRAMKLATSEIQAQRSKCLELAQNALEVKS